MSEKAAIHSKMIGGCTDLRTILFFYSNVGDDSVEEEGEVMGYVLGTFKKKYPSRVMIYSFADLRFGFSSCIHSVKIINL